MVNKEISKGLIKKIKSLHKKSGRDESGLFIAEGFKICSEISNSLYQPEFIVLPGNAQNESIELAENIATMYNCPIYECQRKIFDSLCDTDSPQDIISCLKIIPNAPIINKSFIAFDAISDPGNVGTIIRTAKWFGFEQVLLNKGCADIYNPKTVRSSMGAVMKMNCIKTSNLKNSIEKYFPNHLIIGTFLDGNKDISDVSTKHKIGIIFGNESKGISEELLSVIDEKITITGSGKFDSLNVAVASGIILYELSVKK